MATSLIGPKARRCVRETGFRDQRTGKTVRVELTSSMVYLWAKGDRRRYGVPISTIWIMGAKIRAEEIKRERQAKREAKRKERQR